MPGRTDFQSRSQPVTLRELSKRFGDAVAVDAISLIAEAGKITTLLGPSGCGKTTTLRAIGGFHELDAGEIWIGDTLVNRLPPYARSTRTVFQSYALFPHMSVFENVAFGLRATRVPRRDIKPRVDEALALVGLKGFGERPSGQLSGGQQQRVAFARALVTRPEVLLLDEPLSNLDAKLRVQMRSEIRRVQRELGITMIYVTHDQEEAMSLSDKVVVMSQGRIEQVGPPHEIYEMPASRFVATFIGTTNFIPADVVAVSEQHIRVEALGQAFQLTPAVHHHLVSGQQVELIVRPEHLHIKPAQTLEQGGLEGIIEEASYLGAAASYRVKIRSGETITIHQSAPVGKDLYRVGTHATVEMDEARVTILPS